MVTDEDVKKLAFTIWEEEGRPFGKDAEHYFRAKRALEEQEAKQTLELAPVPQLLELAESPKNILLPPSPKKRSVRSRHKKK